MRTVALGVLVALAVAAIWAGSSTDPKLRQWVFPVLCAILLMGAALIVRRWR